MEFDCLISKRKHNVRTWNSLRMCKHICKDGSNQLFCDHQWQDKKQLPEVQLGRLLKISGGRKKKERKNKTPATVRADGISGGLERRFKGDFFLKKKKRLDKHLSGLAVA